jgi:hypothetical protein
MCSRLGVCGDDFGVAADTGLVARRSRFLSTLGIEPPATAECDRSAVAGGGTLRAISPVEPLRLGPASGIADRLDSIVEDEFESVEDTFTEGSESRVPSLDFSSEGGVSSSLLAPGGRSESMWKRLVTTEDGSFGVTRIAESAGRALRD